MGSIWRVVGADETLGDRGKERPPPHHHNVSGTGTRTIQRTRCMRQGKIPLTQPTRGESPTMRGENAHAGDGKRTLPLLIVV